MKNQIEDLQVTKSWFMRLISLTVVLAFLTPVLTNCQTGKINFSGTWNLNAEKSALPGGGQGGGMRMGGGNFVATQEGNLLTVVRTRTGQDGQAMTSTMKYTLDGKESVNTSSRGESKSVATWSADGKTLTILTSRTFERDGTSTTMKTAEVWTLTNPSTLTVNSTMSTSDGERKSTMVYDKK